MKRKLKRTALSLCLTMAIIPTAAVSTISASAAKPTAGLMLGDTTGDSILNLLDAIYTQKNAVGLIKLDEDKTTRADVDEDGSVKLIDAVIIQKHVIDMPINAPNVGKTWHDDEYDYINHPAVTEDIYVVDKEAHTEDMPVYIQCSRMICNGCGLDITSNRDHVFDCNNGNGASYHTEPVWLYYGTDKWLVENKDVGNCESYLTTGEDVDELGNHYWTSVGVQGAKRAIDEAELMIDNMNWDGEIKLKRVTASGCNICGIYGIENIETHYAQHIANGEATGEYAKWDTWTNKTKVAFKTVEVPEQGHTETKIITPAWTEKILIKKAGWY